MQRTEIGSDLKTGFATHAGMTGKHNEDFFGLFAWKIDDQRDLYLGIVADGVGGQTAGEVASHLTVNTVQKYFDEQDSIDDINHHLERAILIANRAVYQASQKNPEYQGMSTTVVMAAILEGRLFTAHVGDSRIYLLRDGKLQQLSVDHTWAQEAIEAGLLTPQQAKVHPNRNVIKRHLGGGSNVEVDRRMAMQTGGSLEISEVNQGTFLRPGDTLLLCSDGLSDMISDEAILESLQSHYQDLPAATLELVDKANQAGGKDNITVMLMQVPGPPQAADVLPGALAAATVTSATGAPVAPAVAPSTAAPATKSGMGMATWLLIGAAGLLLLVVIAAGLIFVISNSFRNESTPVATATDAIVTPDETLPAGVPATAAILATGESATGTAESSSPIDTPGLIPTLRSTPTPTRIRRPTLTATSSPIPAATSATSGGESGDSSGGSGGSDPSTSEPPATEPPTSNPPTSQPPTSKPPQSQTQPPDPSEGEVPPESEPGSGVPAD